MAPNLDEYRSLHSLQVRQRTHREFSEPPDRVEVHTARVAELDMGDAVLDVGPGTGSFVRGLLGSGHRGVVVAVDTSRSAAGAARAAGALSVQGDACSLPLSAGRFDVVFARHMLYHVSDVIGALRQFNRVLVTGGKCVSVVNQPTQAPRLADLLRWRVECSGVIPPVLPQVDSSNLPQMLESVFGNVSVVLFDAQLVFHTPRPLIDFAISLLGFYGVSAGSPLRGEISRQLRADIEQWFHRSSGPWRDPKGYAICLSRRW